MPRLLRGRAAAGGTPMQELRLVAVSEDGRLCHPRGARRSGRVPAAHRRPARTVAQGVSSPGSPSTRSKWRIRCDPRRSRTVSGLARRQTEIADPAGIPPDRVRRFEGPVLAERQYRAQEAQRASIRGRSDSGPGPRLGEIVAERLTGIWAPARTPPSGTRASDPTGTGRSCCSSPSGAGRLPPSGSMTRGGGT